MTRRGVLAAIIACVPGYALAEDEDDQPDPMVLGIALAEAPVTLEAALRSVALRGIPISAKFGMPDGDLRLSVYAAAGSRLIEVLIDPKTGAVTSSRPLTDPEDLADAVAQKRALEKAKLTLLAVLAKLATDYPASRVVSAAPELRGGHPILVVVLLSGTRLTSMSASLE